MITLPCWGVTSRGIEHAGWPHPVAAKLGDASRKEAAEGVGRRPGFAKAGGVDGRESRSLPPVGVVEVDLTPSVWDFPSVDDFDRHAFTGVGSGQQ